jgi:hypothetical protein
VIDKVLSHNIGHSAYAVMLGHRYFNYMSYLRGDQGPIPRRLPNLQCKGFTFIHHGDSDIAAYILSESLH